MPAPKDKNSVEYKLYIQRLKKSHLGHRNSPEAYKKSGEAHTGPKNHNWKGGITKDPIHRSWVKNKRNRIKQKFRAEGNSFTYGEWETLKAQYNWTCPACQRSEPVIKLTEDHIIPLSKGGSDNIENIQPLCLSCNCKKADKIIHY